jgi:putative NADPH-quinone reductase
MSRRIAIIQGHPDAAKKHFGHALADAYADGAAAGGHAVKVIAVAELDFPLLRDKEAWEHDAPPAPIRQAQETIAWADHLVFIYPLWMGTMPAVLKAFLEQVFRPGFAIRTDAGKTWTKLLKGRSARIVVTMGMPAFFYRWFFRAHSLKSLERNILALVGIGPIKTTLIGMVEAGDGGRRAKWLVRMNTLGRAGR